ncbi:ABC transporter ATP-binding protein [Bosea lathyri]|uniref:Putative spermidine/putrescine transport system ATP-binding protein n=1 Tax=Bosea lathyri TaxID=1036778 RepID=A0A1H6CKE9_9HYPH|nr:ABC transporter ATP-binding protein [Bosea lathyri]SEG72896.1 putative spermidine/putrescine transport system ATP-binding protein [Bosea lathyri]
MIELAAPPLAAERPALAKGRPHLAVRDIVKSYGGASRAVDGVSLDLAKGEFVTLLGDSGCGKTSLLRIIAGFVQPDGGRVLRAEQDVTEMAPARRRMGFVFQSYALFPTKTVAENIGFALTIASRGRDERERRVAELARLVEMERLLERYPHELSGGQQQRVALARSLASDPEVLLLDEPMSALDARIRVKLRTELRSIIDRLGITTLYVTHDQEEALALSDRVAVMRNGRIEQIGTPAEIYHRPASTFLAQFIGVSNLVEGHAVARGVDAYGEIWPLVFPPRIKPGERVTAVYRPEHIAVVAAAGPEAMGLTGRIASSAFLGAVLRLTVTLDSGRTVIADCPSHEAERIGGRGAPVAVVPDARRAALIPGRSQP